MKPISDILAARDPKKGKYSKNEFQVYCYELAVKLEDLEHKTLYIKLAKSEDRKLLEDALSFVKDSRARSKGKLFMWKLKDLREQRTPSALNSSLITPTI